MIRSQIHDLVDALLKNRESFGAFSVDDGRWVAENPKKAISCFSQAVRKRRKKSSLLIDPVGVIKIPKNEKEFIDVEEFFKGSRKIKFISIGENLKRWFFLGKNKKIEKFEGSDLGYGVLQETSMDKSIIEELGGKKKAETTLSEVISLLGNQPKGDEGYLLTDGNVNIFYVPDSRGVLLSVVVSWHNGWKINTFPIAEHERWSNKWIDGSQVFFRVDPSDPKYALLF